MIGIWKQHGGNGAAYYERDRQQIASWHLWANVHRLYPKNGKQRIVLLGESVARGYFYDPFYTVAGELQAILNKSAGALPYEVVDLARTSMTMQGMVELVRSCGALGPDAVVIFAGNNWYLEFYHLLGAADHKELSAAFKARSFEGLKQVLEQKFREFIVTFFEEVTTQLVRQNIPLLFIIPGYNLKDWKSDPLGKSISWLPGDGVQQWLSACKRAQNAGDNLQEIKHAAEQMVHIDPFNPYGFELLSQYYIKTAQWDNAKQCLQAGRDAMLIRRGGNMFPVSFGILQETVLEEAGKAGIEVLDLAALFNNIKKDGIPDRELYLDYCHLTVKGIKLAMRHAARMLMEIITGKEIAPSAITPSSLEPSNDVKGIAHFFAAIHNAHRDQPEEILQFHCRKALSYSPEVKDAMLSYVDFSSRHTPTVLCSSYQQLMAQGKFRQYEGGLPLQHPRNGKLMDIPLVNAIAAAMSAAGIKLEHNIRALRIEEHGVGPESVDLLSSFYSHTCYTGSPGSAARPLYSQVRSNESRFSFIADAANNLQFTIVCRTCGKNENGRQITITVNNKVVAGFPMSNTWSKQTFVVSSNHLTAGVNKLLIEWPYTSFSFPHPGNCVSAAGLIDAVAPVAGEIHSFWVRSI